MQTSPNGAVPALEARRSPELAVSATHTDDSMYMLCSSYLSFPRDFALTYNALRGPFFSGRESLPFCCNSSGHNYQIFSDVPLTVFPKPELLAATITGSIEITDTAKQLISGLL